MSTAIWWIRRDLRLFDNQALNAALSQSKQVIPVFILDPLLLKQSTISDTRFAFLLSGLQSLDHRLRERGSRLLLRTGEPQVELQSLMAESGANAIFAEADFSPYAQRRDKKIAAVMPLQCVAGLTVHPPQTVLKADGKPYTVFTPYSRRWKTFPLPTAVDLYDTPTAIDTPDTLISECISEQPALLDNNLFNAGEAEAQRRLHAFTQGSDAPIFNYAQGRNRLDINGTSSLSPYLHLGMISARQAVVAAREAIDQAENETAEKGAETWLNELIWREFFIAIHYHFPHVHRESFRENLRTIPWKNDKAQFTAWCEGRTGYPVVDAAMRQLAQTGWIHNRARMIVASFLVKNLLIDWRWGEKWFMKHLIDGDPAANNGGWQWTAGTGTDAAPYFRIFNPITQSQKFDPQGKYIRQWVPELANLTGKAIHQPWLLSPIEQQLAHCVIGQDYPAPIVDHAESRKETLGTKLMKEW